jgi:hypothetical protein
MPAAEVAGELVVEDAGADLEQETGHRGVSSASAALLTMRSLAMISVGRRLAAV